MVVLLLWWVVRGFLLPTVGVWASIYSPFHSPPPPVSRFPFLCDSYGRYKALNRIGIGTSPSPLHKASFETTMNFVTKDTIRGNMDALRNPSARIVLGQLVGGGTGCVDLLVPLQ